jgi:hypothetical protein
MEAATLMPTCVAKFGGTTGCCAIQKVIMQAAYLAFTSTCILLNNFNTVPPVHRLGKAAAAVVFSVITGNVAYQVADCPPVTRDRWLAI